MQNITVPPFPEWYGGQSVDYDIDPNDFAPTIDLLDFGDYLGID